MEDEIISRLPLVRVTRAFGRLAPCEHLPLYAFRAGDGASRRPPSRYAPTASPPAKKDPADPSRG